MMVVDDMASMPPRNTQSMRAHPKRWPTTVPANIMQRMMVMAAIMGAMPILSIFLNEKSRPRENSRKMTPMSAHICTSALSITDMV